MKTRLGMTFYIDYAHNLPGHLRCGKEHGHTAKILIEIEGEVKGGPHYKDNMLIDFSDMKKICKTVLNELDHRNLNELFVMPTSEIITNWIYTQLIDKSPIVKVIFFEGEGKWCEVSS
ncbi:MAG: 6-pyruvoyl trahydropterin synthase family protein [Candidatus Nitrosocosmicus sp.]